MVSKKSVSSKSTKSSKTLKKSVKPAAKVAKKTVAKKATKTTVHSAVKKSAVSKHKPSTQPVVSRVRVYNLTRDIPSEKHFILSNGQPVKNVAELAALLDQLEDHVFNHHVTGDRNDFHNWVKDVFEDVVLAQKIAGVNDKKHMQLVIYRHMAGHE